MQRTKSVKSPTKPQLLHKDWLDLEHGMKILSGNCSQSHKKFKGHNEQSASVCTVACVLSSLIPSNLWTRALLDKILEMGTNLHLRSRQMSENRCTSHIDPRKVYKYFYADDNKVSVRMGVNIMSVKVPQSSSLPQQMEELVTKFFEKNPSGIFGCQNVYLGIWKVDKYYYIFDPRDHAIFGGKWPGLPGLGFCCVIRTPNPKRLSEIILSNIPMKTVNTFTIYPCALEKTIKVNTIPPETVDEKPEVTMFETKAPVQKLPQRRLPQAKPKTAPPTATPTPAPTPAPASPSLSAQGSATAVPEGGDVEPKPSVSLSRIPPERPRLKSITNFVDLIEGRMGILRASTHQCDPKFTRYLGAQSMANAVAALTMLRQYKSRSWIRTVLDDVLKLGEVIHHDSKKLKPGELVDKITLKDKDYSLKMEKFGTVGRLTSDLDNILSLPEALANFLIDNDCCIVIGPLIVAIWKEGTSFFMFDPNERDDKGNAIQPGGPPGVACVTWFTSLHDLIAVYLANVPKQERNDRFLLSKVVIRDYQAKALDWFNFRALTVNKWILRGHFSQADRRFPSESRNSQCTANSTIALAYKELKPEQEWDSGTVDELLMNGDQFYRNTVEYLKENNKYHASHLMVDEVLRTFDVENKRINFEIDDCLVNGILNAKSETGIPNLKRGFEEFFDANDAGVVTANAQTMAVWKRDNVFYYFDSHSRNEKGIVCGYGTACCLRLVTIDDLAKALTTNLGANQSNMFNISRIVVHLIDLTDEGVVKPPLNNYESLGDFIAILRSNFSEKDEKFDLNCGKQTVPMCVAAITMNTLTPSFTWSKDDLDEVLNIGDKLYTASMEANYEAEIPEEYDVDEISTGNVKKDLKIGQNSFDIFFDILSEGTIEHNVAEAIDNFYQFSEQQGFQSFQAVLESPYMTASMWRDENLIYLFDPKPRDPQGQVYGKDDWSAKVIIEENVNYDDEEETNEEEEEYVEGVDEMGGGDTFGPIREGDEEMVKQNITYESEVVAQPRAVQIEEPAIPNEPQTTDEPEIADEPEIPEEVPVEKKGSAYWQNLEDSEGKACVLRFSRIEDLINHVIENSPPNKRDDIQYTFKSVKVDNRPVLHEIFNPEEGEEKDEIMGDWNQFKELDYGKWILRSARSYLDALFPECNRGRQQVAMCITANAFVYLYAVSKYKDTILDSLLSYGDRFYTVLRRMREKELKSNKELKLTDQQVEEILNAANFKITDYPKKLCMGEKLAKWEVQSEMVFGDITSKVPEEIPDVLQGLTILFTEHEYGVLECKDYFVSVWKLDDSYYMFDPHPTGPSGFKSPIGVACITRFKNLSDLAELFVRNLPRIGDNFFVIHAFTFDKDECKRPRKPEVKEEKPLKMGGFTQVMAGKQILRGSKKLDCTKFDRGVHLHSPAVAFVTLAISLAVEPETWTKIMVDEILNFGEGLYNETLAKLGDKFNTWEDRLDLYRLNNDFQIGSLKANCTLRYREQRGIVDVKNAKMPNLRQGLERFFEENSHGVLVAGKLILPLWEEPKGDDINIYVFDPNSRGPTGLPAQGGVACVMKFCNAKVAADHIMATMMDMDKAKTEFAIVPVEVVVGHAKSKRKVCKYTIPRTIQPPSVIQPSVKEPSSVKHSMKEPSMPKASIRETSVPKASLREPSTPKASVRGPSIPKTSIRGPSIPKASMREPFVPKASIREPSTPKASVRGPSIPKASVRGPSIPKTSSRPSPSITKPSIGGPSKMQQPKIKAPLIPVGPCSIAKPLKPALIKPTPVVHPTIAKLPKTPVATSTKPVTCPTAKDIMEERRQFRKIAEEKRQKDEIKKQSSFGRQSWYQVSSGVSIIRALRSVVEDRELPVNIAAFVLMKVTRDLNTWDSKHLELILEAGNQLYMDSYNTFKPPTPKLGLQHVLRRVVLKGFEVKVEIKKPVICPSFTRENILNNLNKFFTLLNFCMLSYRDFLVSIYFKGGYYYLFDPYSRDIHGNKVGYEGSAVLMRFDNLSSLVDKLVSNFGEGGSQFALIVVSVQQVQPLSSN